MGLRLVSALVLAVTLGVVFPTYSCQDSGIGAGNVLSLGVEQFHLHQKFNSAVTANTWFDQWDGKVPFTYEFSQTISVAGSFKPPAGQTLPITSYMIEPTVICPNTTASIPTVPPMVTINVNPTNLTFKDSFQMDFSVCKQHMTGVNILPAFSRVTFSASVNGDAPAGSSVDAIVSTKY
jgi:hypothetical protein